MAPATTRRARPTSITTDSGASTTRVIVPTHARRCTVAAETGTEYSMSPAGDPAMARSVRSEEHTSELQSRSDLVCRLLLEKKKKKQKPTHKIKQKKKKKKK